MRVILAIFLTTAASTFAQTGTGVLAGQILDERHRPVHGARVDISAIPRAQTTFRPFQASKLTGADGSFTFSAAQGNYRVCVQLHGSSLLDPCMWAAPPPSASITAAQTLRMQPIVLKRGYPITLQFVDPTGVLPQVAGKPSSNLILAGITAPNGMFYPMAVRQKSAALREHVMLVPRDMNLTVTIHNRGFDIADSKGVPVAAAAQPYSFAVEVAGEKHPRLFTFQVNGLHVGN